MTRTLYTARAQRDGKWWAVSVAGLPGALTQVRRLDQAEAMAREVIAMVLDVSEDAFDVTVTPDLTKPQRAALDALNQAKANYEKAAAAVTKRQQDVTALLVRKDGLTVRDAAEVLGVSFQRVSQLTAAGTPKKATASAWTTRRATSAKRSTSSK